MVKEKEEEYYATIVQNRESTETVWRNRGLRVLYEVIVMKATTWIKYESSKWLEETQQSKQAQSPQ